MNILLSAALFLCLKDLGAAAVAMASDSHHDAFHAVNGLGSEYAIHKNFHVKYTASCHCGAVEYQACNDPVDAKICHCRDCQRLHGAPMQWAAIFHKRDILLTKGKEHVKFYNSELGEWTRVLPCKVSCGNCGTPIADEGRTMWLAFPTLFHFDQIPDSFRPSCHIFYGSRVLDNIKDDIPKWSGHKGRSTLL
jgi:hypothetical protein